MRLCEESFERIKWFIKNIKSVGAAFSKVGSTIGKVSSKAKGAVKNVFNSNIMKKIRSNLIKSSERRIQYSSNLAKAQNIVNTKFGNSANEINNWSQSF